MTHQAASKGCSQSAGIDVAEGRWEMSEDAEAYWMFVLLGNGAIGRWMADRLQSLVCKHKLACFGSFVWISTSSL